MTTETRDKPPQSPHSSLKFSYRLLTSMSIPRSSLQPSAFAIRS